jgi:hypothetical protein
MRARTGTEREMCRALVGKKACQPLVTSSFLSSSSVIPDNSRKQLNADGVKQPAGFVLNSPSTTPLLLRKR